MDVQEADQTIRDAQGRDPAITTTIQTTVIKSFLLRPVNLTVFNQMSVKLFFPIRGHLFVHILNSLTHLGAATKHHTNGETAEVGRRVERQPTSKIEKVAAL